jgi:hypothetical protein
MDIDVIFLVIFEYPTLVLVLRGLDNLLRDYLADVVNQQRFFQAVIVQLHSDLSYL